jgi:hypothetical protein
MLEGVGPNRAYRPTGLITCWVAILVKKEFLYKDIFLY